MTSRALTAVVVVLLLGGLGAAIALGACGGEEEPPGGEVEGTTAVPAPQEAVAEEKPEDQALRAVKGPVTALPNRPLEGRYFAIAELRDKAEVPLRASPGGRLIDTVGSRSEFGSPRVLGVAREHGSWLGVITPLLPNGQIGWIRNDSSRISLYWTRYWLSVSLSRRLLTLRYGDRELGRYTVTVGATGTDTPEGRFAITDALSYDDSPYYGCCALALSGHQEKLPVGWLGGDRIAIHGTPGAVGYAASNGCIRATDRTMRVLFRRIPLGTPVFVRG
jgi:L,D-transpeptidase catalytic domain